MAEVISQPPEPESSKFWPTDPVSDPTNDASVDEPADFDMHMWEPQLQKYGLHMLLVLRESMLPIEKPPEMAHWKFFHCPNEAGDEETQQPEARGQRDRRAKGKGKGNDKSSHAARGRFVQDMGKTEVMEGSHRGQWWKNVCADEQDVIVKEQFALTSQEIFKVPTGHYVQQSGHCEVFVSGQATGLQRMPVSPKGWATVDASSVGGPKYLEQVSVPMWKVAFKSGSAKGDIVIRATESLDSEEVGVLFVDSRVEQSGPQEILEDGIVRMPINFNDSSSRSTKPKVGWVTCDATSQGGPKFFEPCDVADDRPAVENSSAPSVQPPAANSWDKNRLWKVVNLEAGDGRQLPVVKKTEPYAPGTGRVPAEEIVVRWLKNEDILEQIGHSKKMRGYMVMPVRLTPSPGENKGEELEGWVTRRLVDKARDHAEGSWLQEIREEGRARRKPRHHED